MNFSEEVFTSLQLAALYISNVAGKEVVKKAAGEFFDYVKDRMSTSKAKKLIDELVVRPKDEQVIQAAKQYLSAYIITEAVSSSELNLQFRSFMNALQRHDADWLKENNSATNNTQTITGDKNIAVQGSSQVTINKGK